MPGESVLDIPLLRRIHLLSPFTLQKDCLDLGVEKLPGPGIPRVKAVVVDEDRLVFEPITPTVLADSFENFLPYGVPEGSLLQLRGVFFAAAASDGLHGGLGSMGGWPIVPERIKLQKPPAQSREAFDSRPPPVSASKPGGRP